MNLGVKMSNTIVDKKLYSREIEMFSNQDIKKDRIFYFIKFFDYVETNEPITHIN